MTLLIYYTPLLLALKLWSVKGTCQNYDLYQNEEVGVAVAFQSSGITPDIVPVPPPDELTVLYETAEARLGNRIFPVRTLDAPAVAYKNANATSMYTLVVLDVDQPSQAQPRLRSFINLLYVNILGEALLPPPSLNYENGCPISLYFPISPVPGSGTHRVVAVLCEQTAPIDTTNYDLLYLGVYRIEFNLTEFIANYTLIPAAGNFWTTDFPEDYGLYCPVSKQGICCK